jgi:hypothetical protein
MPNFGSFLDVELKVWKDCGVLRAESSISWGTDQSKLTPWNQRSTSPVADAGLGSNICPNYVTVGGHARDHCT